MQNFNTDDMAHKIPRCIEWVTSIHTLEPGDILATGTNHRGLNAFQDGDMVELETEGLGRLRFNVRDDLKRTWARETRLERQEKKLEGHDAAAHRQVRAAAPKEHPGPSNVGRAIIVGLPQPTAARQHLAGEALELGELVVADEADAEVGDAGLRVAAAAPR